MKSIDPPQMPKIGDEVEIAADSGKWIPGVVTKVDGDYVMGSTDWFVFSHTIRSYRVNWRFR